MTFASPFPDVDVPNISLYDYLFAGLDGVDENRVALVDSATNAEVSYRGLVSSIDSFAGTLARFGIGVGDVVALLSPNSSAFAVAFHAILRTGATVTPVNTMLVSDEIARQLRDSGARTLITVNDLQQRGREAAAAVGLSSRDVLVLGTADVTDADGAGCPKVDVDPATQVAALPYSSGTTGIPKGVMLTHRNLVANAAQTRPLSRLTPEETILAVVPFFHCYGLMAFLCAALYGRSRLIVMPAFNLRDFLIAIERYQCTQAYIAPPIAVALAKNPIVDAFNLSSLHTLTCSAAPLDEEVAGAVMQRLGCRVVQAYGMSELSPGSHMVPYDGGLAIAGREAPLNACGWTLPNSKSKIIDVDSGIEIPLPTTGLSKPGELCVHGPNVMAGYLGNPDATALTIDTEGFLHTGDLARVDASGCVYIVDRVKELIKYKGHQVPPAELEALLLTHPGIADAAVVGVVDTVSGEEIPKAFVVKQGESSLSEDLVMDFVAEKVAHYKMIRQVEFIDAVPKAATGKILRKQLRARRSS